MKMPKKLQYVNAIEYKKNNTKEGKSDRQTHHSYFSFKCIAQGIARDWTASLRYGLRPHTGPRRTTSFVAIYPWKYM